MRWISGIFLIVCIRKTVLHFLIWLECLSWKILCASLATLLEQLHLVRLSIGIMSMIMRRCPTWPLEFICFSCMCRRENVCSYPTLHACCVADTNLHTSLSTCSTSVTDGRSPRFRSRVASIWNFFDFGVVVTRTSACFRKRQIPMQVCEERLERHNK